MKRLNQILSVDNNSNNKKGKKVKTKSSGPIEISNIVKFFSIAILVFGIFMIGTGSYSMYKETNKQASITKPEIRLEQTAGTELTLKVTHDKELVTITYQWNEEEPTTVQTNGKKEVETRIEMPTGVNNLKVQATDIKGEEVEFTKEYTVESDIEINLEPEGANLKLTATGNNQLQYMTYRWDEEDETKIDINDYEIEETIEIPKGLHTLTVIVVDENNKTETKKQEVNGVTKPKLEVTTDGINFNIKASDEQGIKKIEFIINEEEKYLLNLEKELSLEERKEFEYAYPLHDGENKLEVIVYNESDVTENFRALFRK